jgi:hypothetical protein
LFWSSTSTLVRLIFIGGPSGSAVEMVEFVAPASLRVDQAGLLEYIKVL